MDKVLEAVDTEVVEMIRAVRESEENYEKEKEEAKNKEQQIRLTRQTNRSDFNFLTMSSSTPIRNNNTTPHTTTNQHQWSETAVHFDLNTVCHVYPTTNLTMNSDWYEPPANDSIIQGAGSAPGGHFMKSTSGVTGRNKLWKYNNKTNTATCTNLQTRTTRPSGRNFFHNNLPNSSDNRNGHTCSRCGEQGHMRLECSKERVYCTHCRTPNNNTKACRKHHNSTPSPQTATSQQDTTVQQHNHHYWEQQQLGHIHNRQVQPPTDLCSRTILTPTNHPHTLQWHITSTISQHDRSVNTNHNASHQQHQEG